MHRGHRACAAVLTAGVMAEIESLLCRGRELGGGRPEAWPEAEHAAKGDRRRLDLPRRQKEDCGEPIAASTKSQPSEIDCAAPMGQARRRWNGWRPALDSSRRSN